MYYACGVPSGPLRTRCEEKQSKAKAAIKHVHDRTNAQPNQTTCKVQYTAPNNTIPHHNPTQHNTRPYLARPLCSDRLVGLYRDGFRVRPQGGDAHGRAAATAKRRRPGGQCLRAKTRSSLIADENVNVTRPWRLGRWGAGGLIGRTKLVSKPAKKINNVCCQSDGTAITQTKGRKEMYVRNPETTEIPGAETMCVFLRGG